MTKKSRVVEFTSAFKRNLRRLSKKYRSIRSDIEPVIQQIIDYETPGDQVPATGYAIFKVRIKNSDTNKGKRGGYRMIYYLETADRVLLLTIYSKSDQGDVSANRLKEIVESYES